MWPFSQSEPQPSAGEDGTTTTRASTLGTPEPLPAQLPTDLPPIESPSSLAKRDDLPLTGYPNERLTILPQIRWQILFLTIFTYGFSVGATSGGRKAADRYRAMNAHRQPSTQAGWYLYQRSKSYHTTIGGVKGGFKRGSVLVGWSALFSFAEEGLDQARSRLFARRDEDFAPGQRDFVNTTTAALTTAGVYSRWHNLDVFATTKLARVGLKYGLAYGLVQDVMSTVTGEAPRYISWARRIITGREDR